MRVASLSLAFLTFVAALAAQEPTADELLRAVERKLVAVNETAGPSVACVVVSRSEKYPKPATDTPGVLGGFDPKQFVADNPKAARLAVSLDLSDHRTIPDHGFACGVVIDDKGFVLTPYHVVEGATKIYVHLPGRVGSYADIHAADARHDLAVLRLLSPPPALKAVKFTDMRSSRAVPAGKLVVIAENGYTATVPVDKAASVLGSVTRVRPHLDESIEDKLQQPRSSYSYYYHGPFIEYSATLKAPRLGVPELAPPAWAVSGAALLNLDGELIGLTTTAPILGHGDKTPGYAFPMDENVRRVIEVLRRGEEVEYGFLGVSLNSSGGQIVLGSVLPFGPSAQAGLRPGDVITHINDIAVKSYPDLLVHIGSALAGTKVKLTVRSGANRGLEVPLVLGKLKHERPVIVSLRPTPVFGLRVDYDSVLAQAVTLDAQAILDNRLLGIPVGVSVREVVADSPAATAFKKLGDRPDRWLITHLNGNAVTSPAEFYTAAKGQKAIKLTVIDPTEAKRPQREVMFP